MTSAVLTFVKFFLTLLCFFNFLTYEINDIDVLEIYLIFQILFIFILYDIEVFFHCFNWYIVNVDDIFQLIFFLYFFRSRWQFIIFDGWVHLKRRNSSLFLRFLIWILIFILKSWIKAIGGVKLVYGSSEKIEEVWTILH